MLTFANNFLAGSLITLLIPACMFIAVTIWYTYSVLRLAARRPEGTPNVPEPAVPSTSGLATTDAPASGATTSDAPSAATRSDAPEAERP